MIKMAKAYKDVEEISTKLKIYIYLLSIAFVMALGLLTTWSMLACATIICNILFNRMMIRKMDEALIKYEQDAKRLSA